MTREPVPKSLAAHTCLQELYGCLWREGPLLDLAFQLLEDRKAHSGEVNCMPKEPICIFSKGNIELCPL